jgi:hypothetical protein
MYFSKMTSGHLNQSHNDAGDAVLLSSPSTKNLEIICVGNCGVQSTSLVSLCPNHFINVSNAKYCMGHPIYIYGLIDPKAISNC